MKPNVDVDIPQFMILSKDINYTDFKRCFKHCVNEFT